MKIEVPFNAWSKERILDGRKTATSRTKALGECGDWFPVGDKKFVMLRIFPTTLNEVANFKFKKEGARSIAEFIKVWKSIYRGQYDGDRTVYFHEFKELSGL
jgi:hypothetical protein